jgi:hypothetical protein
VSFDSSKQKESAAYQIETGYESLVEYAGFLLVKLPLSSDPLSSKYAEGVQ